MKLRLDYQHVTLLLISGLTAFGPAMLRMVPQSSLQGVYDVAGPLVAVLTTCLTLLKGSIVVSEAK